MTLGKLLERAMQVIVGLRLAAHRTGEVTPEMEAEARETLAKLYGAKQEVEPDSLEHENVSDNKSRGEPERLMPAA